MHATFWGLLPAMLLGGVGMSAAMAPTTAAAMASVRPDKAGVGSAVLNSMRQVGGSLGIAIMGAIVASGISSSLASGHSRPEAFVDGFQHATPSPRSSRSRARSSPRRRSQHARHREPARDDVPRGRMSVARVRLPAAERRRLLIETAIRVFSDGSYRGTTTAEIARAAGISEPILYRHFASKRELYLAALDHVWSKARARWSEVLEGAPRRRARASRRWAAATSRSRDCKFQLAELWVQALGEAAEDAELRKHLRKHMREVHDFIADAIRRGQEEGVAPRRTATRRPKRGSSSPAASSAWSAAESASWATTRSRIRKARLDAGLGLALGLARRRQAGA